MWDNECLYILLLFPVSLLEPMDENEPSSLKTTMSTVKTKLLQKWVIFIRFKDAHEWDFDCLDFYDFTT